MIFGNNYRNFQIWHVKLQTSSQVEHTLEVCTNFFDQRQCFLIKILILRFSEWRHPAKSCFSKYLCQIWSKFKKRKKFSDQVRHAGSFGTHTLILSLFGCFSLAILHYKFFKTQFWSPRRNFTLGNFVRNRSSAQSLPWFGRLI